MSPRRPHRGFTLVELLVVIVIISLLAALITPAVMAAMRAAKRTAISTEISNLHAAIEQYKAQYGSYPPQDTAGFKQHLNTIFINLDSNEASKVPNNMTPAQVLVFALQGYSDNKRFPISGGTRKPLFNFVPDRLSTTGAGAVYYSLNTSNTPYVYFDCSRYTGTNNSATQSGNGGIGPYKVSGGGSYANAKSFQIISTGLDNDFGGGSVELKSGSIKDGHADNLTNFSSGSQLIDYIDK